MLSRIFLAVAGMSANAGLLVLAILAVRLVTRRRMPKWGNCLLWGLVAVCLMCPVLPESVLSVRPQPGQAALPAAAAMETASPGAGITLTDLAWVWLVGMAAVLGWAAASYLRLRRQVAASIRVGKQVYLCDDISSPFILGIFRPRVYLPSGLEGETLQSVLRHEGAHLRRRDHWWKPLGHLLVAVYWFHPLIWAAYVLLCRDIELACDERVVRDMNRAQRAAYSQALLDCAMPRRRRLVPNTRRTTKRIQQSPIRTFFRRLFLLRLLRVLDLLLPLEYLPLPALLLLLFTGLFPILLTSFTVCTAKTAVSLFAAVIIFCNSKWEENSLGKSCTF